MASLTERDVELLRLIAGVRMVAIDSLRQAHTATEGRLQAAEAYHRWCQRMETVGLVSTSSILAVSPTHSEPLCRYQHGVNPPDFVAVARSLRERSAACAPEQVPVVRLSHRGAAVLGERLQRESRRCELTHDLRLAHFVVHALASNAATAWVSEDQLMREHAYQHVVPDGELTLADGSVLLVECGGIYSPTKLRSFHERIAPQLQSRGAEAYVII